MPVKREAALPALRTLTTFAVVCVVVLVYRKLLHVNPTTVAVTFLLAVLVTSAAWGLRHAVLMSLVSTLAFNFFFLPPVGTFTIADPQNWVALFAFLATAVIASQLSDRVRSEALEADHRRVETEKLYSLSQQLLVTENVIELLNAIPRFIVDTFGAATAAIYLSGRDQIYRSAPEDPQLGADDM